MMTKMLDRDSNVRVIIAQNLAATVVHQLERGFQESAARVMRGIKGLGMYNAVRIDLEVSYKWDLIEPFVVKVESEPNFLTQIIDNEFQ